MTTKNTINNFDWSKFWSKDVLVEAAQTTQIKSKSKWLLPQLLASWAEIPLEYESGVINCKHTLLASLENDTTKQAQHRVLVYLNRGELLDKQTQGDNPHYCTLVPLILSAYKRYRDVAYETWRGAKHLDLVVPHQLLEAMESGEQYKICCDLGSDAILAAREEGLMYKSGKASGTLRSATTTWQLTGVTHPQIKLLPKLAQTMLAQIWCAHPQFRNEYMILDPNNWDNMPPPLVSTELFTSTQPATTKPISDLPWDQ